MGTQQFCLKWNNHQTNMLAVFDQLLQNEAFVDVTLACEGISLKAHKMVLSACSPYFQALFIENPCKHPIVILNSIRYSDLKAIVDFMYKGEVNVSQEQLSALLKTAETLKVKGLAEVTNQTAGIHGSGQVASGGDGSASHPPSSARSTATPPPVQRSSTGSPPPKRKKLRNGASAGSPQQQSNSAGSQSTSSNAAKLNNSEKTTTAAAVNDSAGGGRSHVSSGLDASLDGHSDHDSQRSNDASLPQTLTLSSGAVPSTSQHTDSDVPPEPELIIGSPEASDDKSLLANLTTEMGYDSAGQHESSSKDHQQSILPMSLGAFSGADMSLHPSHSLSIVPSTSGSQNTPPGWQGTSTNRKKHPVLESALNVKFEDPSTFAISDVVCAIKEHRLARVNVQRRCRVCYHVRGERHESIYMCVACGVHVCNPTRRNCYDIHHSGIASGVLYTTRGNNNFPHNKLHKSSFQTKD